VGTPAVVLLAASTDEIADAVRASLRTRVSLPTMMTSSASQPVF
jgi:hypothetical protein